jgi:hypothetical protein
MSTSLEAKRYEIRIGNSRTGGELNKVFEVAAGPINAGLRTAKMNAQLERDHPEFFLGGARYYAVLKRGQR